MQCECCDSKKAYHRYSFEKDLCFPCYVEYVQIIFGCPSVEADIDMSEFEEDASKP
jgi:hypothetical protein